MSYDVKKSVDHRVVLGFNYRNKKLAAKPYTKKPRRFALDIGRNISIELTLAAYGIIPNALTRDALGVDR